MNMTRKNGVIAGSLLLGMALLAGCGDDDSNGDLVADAAGLSDESDDPGAGPVPDEVQDLIDGTTSTVPECAAGLLSIDQMNDTTGLEFTCDGDSYTTADGLWLTLQYVVRTSAEEAAAEHEGFLSIDGYEAVQGDGWRGATSSDGNLVMASVGADFFTVQVHERGSGEGVDAIAVLEALIALHS